MEKRIIIKDFWFQGLRICKDDVCLIDMGDNIIVVFIINDKISTKSFNFITDNERSLFIAYSQEIKES